MAGFHGPRCLRTAAALLVLSPWAMSSIARAAQFAFDLPSAIECREVTPPDFHVAHPALKVVEGKLRISARVVEGNEAEIIDFLYVIDNAARSMRFQDYLPNTMLESAVADDQIEICDATEKAKATGLDARVAYKLFALGGTHNQSSKNSQSSRYKQIAPKELVLASGTTNREHGVFFRLRPSRAASLEGAKEFTFLATVPVTWRGDLCAIACTARTENSSLFSSGPAPGGAARALVPVHMVGDAEAADLARDFRQAQESLAAALAARQNDSVFDTISSHTVGLFTHQKCETHSAKELAAAQGAVEEAQERISQLAR